MKKIFLITALALALFAGVFVCAEAYAEQLQPWNVTVDVVYGGDVFSYDLNGYVNKMQSEAQSRGFYLGGEAKLAYCRRLLADGLPERAVYNYILPSFDDVLKHFSYVERERIDAETNFGKNGFSYTKGQDGVAINVEKLFESMLGSNGRKLTVQLPLTYDRAVTVSQLKQYTVLRGKFTTSYPSSGTNRCHNIALAAQSLNGVTVPAGETFSFNAVVGNRTEANGYKQSKVIMDGNYADGVGGGVCQVSTTLYNALLLAGFVPNAVQHTLVSSYVKAGFDAMVSYGSADLTFTNTTDHPVYIASAVCDKTVTFYVYGEENIYRIERESVESREKFSVEYVVDAQKYPELIYTDQTKVLVSGSDGVKTKSYLKYYVGNKLVKTRLIRTNSYKKVNAVIARGYIERDF